MAAHAIVSELAVSTLPRPHAVVSRLEVGTSSARPHAVISRLEIEIGTLRPHAVVSRLEISTIPNLVGAWYLAGAPARMFLVLPGGTAIPLTEPPGP